MLFVQTVLTTCYVLSNNIGNIASHHFYTTQEQVLWPSFHEDKETETSGLVSAKGKNAQVTRDLKKIILQFTQVRDESQCYFPSQYSVVT